MTQNLTPRAMKDRVTDNMNALVASFGSVSAASRAFGINRQQLNKYLSGARTPSLLTAAKISCVCNVGLDYLLSPPPGGPGGSLTDGAAQDLSAADLTAGAGAELPAPLAVAEVPAAAGAVPIARPEDAALAGVYCAQFVFYMRSPVNPQLVFRGMLSLDAGRETGRFHYYVPNPRRLLGGGGRRYVAAEGRYAARNNLYLLSSSRSDAARGAVFVSALVHLGGPPGGRNTKYSVGRVIGAWGGGDHVAFSENVVLKRLCRPLEHAELAARCAVFDMGPGRARDTLVSILKSLPDGNGQLPI